MAKFCKAPNCGPVPYPDRSGRFLTEGQVVEGDEWAQFLAIGYVVEANDANLTAESVSTVAVASVAPAVAMPEVVAEPVIEAATAAIIAESTSEVIENVAQTDVGAGTEEVDPSSTGVAGDQGVSRRTPGRRRS